jgi:hypothetical protein
MTSAPEITIRTQHNIEILIMEILEALIEIIILLKMGMPEAWSRVVAPLMPK